jgi:hypothetical protein
MNRTGAKSQIIETIDLTEDGNLWVGEKGEFFGRVTNLYVTENKDR